MRPHRRHRQTWMERHLVDSVKTTVGMIIGQCTHVVQSRMHMIGTSLASAIGHMVMTY